MLKIMATNNTNFLKEIVAKTPRVEITRDDYNYFAQIL